MTQFETDLRVIKSSYNKVGVDPYKMTLWRQLKQSFINKYVVLHSPTDTRFNSIQRELSDMDNKLTQKFQQGYLF
jgi:hypothetical protein